MIHVSRVVKWEFLIGLSPRGLAPCQPKPVNIVSYPQHTYQQTPETPRFNQPPKQARDL
jgi:hypothetical protein